MQQLNAPSVRWEWISEAWNQFTKQWSVWVLMMLVVFLIVFAVYLAIFLPLFGMMIATASATSEISEPVGTLTVQLISLLASLVINTVVLWLYGGLYNAAFKQLHGEQIAVGNLFSGGKYLARMIGVVFPFTIGYSIISMVSSLISPILSLISLLPTLIITLIIIGPALFIFPMIVEGGKGSIDAIRGSIEVAKRDWIMFTLFFIVLVLIACVGIFACGIGIIATAPLLFLGQALAYRDCVGMIGAQKQEQFMPPPPPDYRSYTPSQEPQAQPWSAPTYTSPPPQPPWSESTTTTCPHCGATLARATNFCNQCGRPLRSA